MAMVASCTTAGLRAMLHLLPEITGYTLAPALLVPSAIEARGRGRVEVPAQIHVEIDQARFSSRSLQS
eukprot:3472675-Amphidinium_carterae.1